MKTKILWDHTSIGPPVVFHPSLSSPLTLLLKEQTIGLGCRHLSSVDSEHGTFVATLGVDKSGEGLVASIDKFDERTDFSSGYFLLPGDVAVPCTFHQRSVCSETQKCVDYISYLKSAHRNVSDQSEVSLSRCLLLCLHLHLVGPNCKVEAWGLAPTNSFRAIPVPPLPVLPTALSQSMATNPGHTPKTGFLTMDPSQKVLLLLENDGRMKTSPLIGIWVSGVSTLVDPYVWTACLRFFTSPHYHKRAVRPEEPFLLVIYSTLHSGTEFYDCLCNTSNVTYDLLEGQGQLTVTKVPSFTSRVCVVEMRPSDNQKRLKIFRDAHAKFQKEIVPLPYCDSAVLGFPSDTSDYPRSIPSPLAKNFMLKPSVPDLSLLSEVSRCSTKLSPLVNSRPPLRALNHDWKHPSDIHDHSNQVLRNAEPMTTSSVLVKQNLIEPVPKPAPHNLQNENSVPDLRGDVQHLLHSKIGTHQSVHNPISMKNNSKQCYEQRCNSALTYLQVPHGTTRNVQEVVLNSSENVISSADNRTNVNIAQPPTNSTNMETVPGFLGKDHDKQNVTFQNLHQLLKQKDERMNELQEQVRELLDLQRKQIAGPALLPEQIVRHEENDNLLQKMDMQNEQLSQLKEQIALLLDSQSRTPSVSVKSVSPQTDKCSVGVMTSILAEPRVYSESDQFTNTSRRFHGTQQHRDLSPVSTFQSTNSYSKKLGSTRPTTETQEYGKNCCNCRCKKSDEVSVLEQRLQCLNETSLSSEESEQPDVENLRQPTGFSVDGSLPLGASVSLYEDGFRKAVQRGRSGRPARIEVEGRLSLPGRQDGQTSGESFEFPQQRRLSLDNQIESSVRSTRPIYQRDGSMLLPRLNYQTLCFSDESDCEAATPTDTLTKKYLFQKNRKVSSTSAPAIKLVDSSSVDLYSKNMSFATREYLERYGLVS